MLPIIIAIIVLTGICLIIALVLNSAARYFRPNTSLLVDQINAILPQTQCAQCGFPGCKPYAQAIAASKADINRCPPGGETTIQALASLLGKTPMPLAEDIPPTLPPSVAFIDEEQCIGCTLCIQACPVDAILGAQKQMHTVLSDWCTGCELCVAPCPVDCIAMLPRPNNLLQK